jgi:hypothetical protein
VNPKKTALLADHITVRGHLYADRSTGNPYSFRAEGTVSLRWANIGTNLEFSGAQLCCPDAGTGCGLNGSGIRVVGSVFLNSEFSAEGGIRLPGAAIGQWFVWKDVSPDKIDTLDLRSSRIGTLSTDWKGPPKHLRLHGLVYDAIDEPDMTSVETRIAWISPWSNKLFSPQPYKQLAAVLKASGKEEDANRVLIAGEKRSDEYTGVAWYNDPPRVLYGLIMCYGHRPWAALRWVIGIVILGTGIFHWGFRNGLITPTKTQESSQPVHYPKFNALVYSLDTFTPLIDFDQADHWRPNAYLTKTVGWKRLSVNVSGRMVRIYLWLHIFCGWGLISLLAASLTGLVKN